jgi:hypothetical protein
VRCRVRQRVALGLFLLGAGCAPARPLRRAAHDANWAELAGQLRAKSESGDLSLPILTRTSKSLLEGEIERAEGLAGAQRIEGLFSCARPLESALEKRSSKRDAGGGAALLVLQELAPKELGPGEVELSEPHFRAAYVRGLRDQKARLPYLRDPDDLVRRAALDAALENHDASDFDEVSEISRHDPDDLTRSKALRWIGQDASPRALGKLLERFEAGTERQRLFALSGIFEQARSSERARDELYRIALTSPGRVGLEAGLFFVSLPSPKGTEEAKDRVRHRITAFARSGALDERMTAVARLHESSSAWVELLQSNTDPIFGRLAVLAWGELLDFRDSQKSAERSLFTYATGEDALGALARRILSERGYVRLVPRLVRDLNHNDVAVRREAAMNLLALGRVESVARLLADGDAELRVEVACQILSL